MHSGVGDGKALHALGIHSLLNLPSVGRNISDHVSVGLSWSVNSTETLEYITQNATNFNEAFAQWNMTRTGPFVDLGITHVGWLRLDPNSEALHQFPDPSAGRNTAHIELIFSVVTAQNSCCDVIGGFQSQVCVNTTGALHEYRNGNGHPAEP
jgi:choline dehydrogenase